MLLAVFPELAYAERDSRRLFHQGHMGRAVAARPGGGEMNSNPVAFPPSRRRARYVCFLPLFQNPCFMDAAKPTQVEI